MKKFISVVGTRPNFVKAAPLCKAFSEGNHDLKHFLCHTGQHYDQNMSDSFFSQLQLPKPDFYLDVEGGSHAEQTGKIMIGFEKVLQQEKPDLVIVYGDVNSTMACSIVAAKMNVKIAHVESGLRSFDMTMPEEINRIITDRISDFLFVSEPSGLKNLKNEGVPDDKVFFTGNIMIDSLVMSDAAIDKAASTAKFGLKIQEYILTTFHRPSNVDCEYNLREIVELVNFLAEHKKVLLPLHPRTRNKLSSYGIWNDFNENVILIEPLGYFEFMHLQKNAFMIVTDSGGIQEESTFYGVPCITVRENTERPVTVDVGTNYLAGTNITDVKEKASDIFKGNIKKHEIPEFWDGKTACRIKDILYRKFSI